jgi:hypothetical protein
MSTERDSRLYNPANVAAFRKEAQRLTRRRSPERHFLEMIARALAGNDEALQLSHLGIWVHHNCVHLSGGGQTNEYWPLVQAICRAVPALGWAPTRFGIDIAAVR